jgi:hypothetical protein
MSRKTTPYQQALTTLRRLHDKYPSFSLGRHFSAAFADYGDTWNLSDKEFSHALQKYEAELEFNTPSESEIDRIIRDGMNLDTILQEEDEEDF